MNANRRKYCLKAGRMGRPLCCLLCSAPGALSQLVAGSGQVSIPLGTLRLLVHIDWGNKAAQQTCPPTCAPDRPNPSPGRTAEQLIGPGTRRRGQSSHGCDAIPEPLPEPLPEPAAGGAGRPQGQIPAPAGRAARRPAGHGLPERRHAAGRQVPGPGGQRRVAGASGAERLVCAPGGSAVTPCCCARPCAHAGYTKQSQAQPQPAPQPRSGVVVRGQMALEDPAAGAVLAQAQHQQQQQQQQLLQAEQGPGGAHQRCPANWESLFFVHVSRPRCLPACFACRLRRCARTVLARAHGLRRPSPVL